MIKSKAAGVAGIGVSMLDLMLESLVREDANGDYGCLMMVVFFCMGFWQTLVAHAAFISHCT